MATKINEKTLFDLDAFLADPEADAAEFAVGKYTGLQSKANYESDDMEAWFTNPASPIKAEIDGNDLVFTFDLNNNDEIDKTITVTGYKQANGKGKFNLLVGKDWDAKLAPNDDYVNILDAGIVMSGNKYDASVDSLIYNSTTRKVTSSFTATNFNDNIDLSDFQATNPQGAAYIKKGFTAKGGEGVNTFEGSVLNDNYTGGANVDTITASAGNDTYALGGGVNRANYAGVTSFGNDTYKLAKDSTLALDFGGEAEDLVKTVKGSDLAISKDVSYYATVKVDKDFVVDGHLENAVYDEKGNLISCDAQDKNYNWRYGKQSIVNALEQGIWEKDGKFYDLTWMQKNEATLIENGTRDDYNFQGGYLKLTMNKWSADSYYFQTGELYKNLNDQGKLYGVKLGLAIADLNHVNAGTFKGENGYYGAWYNVPSSVAGYGPYDINITDLSITKVTNGVESDYKATYLAGPVGPQTEAEYNEALYNSQVSGSVVLKNAATAGATISVNNDILTGENAIAFNEDVTVKGTNITGTAFGDIVDLHTEDDGFTVKTLAGNDEVTTSTGDDILTLGTGKNTLTHTAGDDIVNLTKGEELTVENNFNHYNVIGNDVIASYDDEEAGSVTFKNFAKGNTGAEVLVNDGAAHLEAVARYNVELGDDLTKFTSPFLGADVTVDAEGTEKALTVDLSKSQFDNTVTLTNLVSSAEGKVTVKGGSADDIVVDGTGNGTYTLGYSEDGNTLEFQGGDDVVNLTADKKNKAGVVIAHEETSVDMTEAENVVLKVVKNDVVATAYDGDNKIGSVTFKNYAAKDVGATLNLKASIVDDPDFDAELSTYNFETTWSEAAGSELTSKTKSFTGSRLNDVVNASEFVVKDRAGDPIEIVAEPAPLPVDPTPEQKAAYKDALKEYNTYLKTKGVTVDAKDGANEFEGSIYADTYKGGAGVDAITASAGNDSYALGKGANTAEYTFAGDAADFNYHKDTYTLVNDSLLNITTDANAVAYSKVGNDIVMNVTTDDEGAAEIVLKNYATGKIDANVSVDMGGGLENIWNQDINIEATSATTQGTLGNDVITSNRSANTFVESYRMIPVDPVHSVADFGDNNVITSKGTKDNIQISAFDKKAPKMTAYDAEFSYEAVDGKDALVIETDAGDITYKQADGDALVVDVDLDTVTFTDATNTKWAFTNDVNDEPADEYKASAKTNNIAWTNSATITDAKKNDIVYGSDANQVFNYSAGKDLYAGADGNDTYNATLDKKTTLIVSDNEGVNVLNFGVKDDFSIFFDVDLDDVDPGEPVDPTAYAIGEDLAILNESSFYDKNGNAIVKSARALTDKFAAGSIVLDGVLDDGAIDGFTLNAKTGSIVSNVTATVNANIDAIAQDVAGWLATNNFDTAMDALELGSNTQVQELMALYTYNPAQA